MFATGTSFPRFEYSGHPQKPEQNRRGKRRATRGPQENVVFSEKVGACDFFLPACFLCLV